MSYDFSGFWKKLKDFDKTDKKVMDKFKHKGSSKIIPVSVGSRLKMNTYLVDCDDDVDDEDVTRKFL